MVRTTTVKGLRQMTDRENDEHIDRFNRGDEVSDDDRPPAPIRPPAPVELPHMPEEPESAPAAPSMNLQHAGQWGTAEDADRKARTIYPIKTSSEFEGDMLLDAGDLENISHYLMSRIDVLEPLRQVSIGWYWRRQGGRSHGDVVLYRIGKADETLSHEQAYDVVVKFSADHLRTMKSTELFIEYLVLGALVRIDANGPRVLPDSIWMKLPGWFRYGYLGPMDRLFGKLVGNITDGHPDDKTVNVDAPDTTGGVQLRPDGTPMTDDEIKAQEAAETLDDPATDGTDTEDDDAE